MTGNEIMIPMILSFGISALLGPILIPFLRKLKISQTVRDDGPDSHLKKSGTPTMGGILILISLTATSALYVEKFPLVIPILFLTLGFGMIGFLDDYMKVIYKSSMGLTPLQKLVLQIVVTAAFACYMFFLTDIPTAMRIPFVKGYYIDFGWLNVPMLFLIIIGTANGANFTDGLDGLASSVTVIISTFFIVVSVGTGVGITPATCAVTGALLGFLLFNVHPASVFMGDTGSLALGGFVAACAYVMQMQLFLPVIGIIYVAEVMSVILQVVFFRVSGGKRIFKMAPIHHHFELGGWKETTVVAVFAIITAVMCLLALSGIS